PIEGCRGVQGVLAERAGPPAVVEEGKMRRMSWTRSVIALIVGCALAVVAGCDTTTSGTPSTPTDAGSEEQSTASPTTPQSPGAAPVAELPVPIEFSLPDGWQSVPPSEVNADNAAFVAVHPGFSGDEFTPTIVIAGDVHDGGTTLTQLAEEELEQLRTVDPDVRVEERRESGTADHPGLTQVVRLSMQQNGSAQELLQIQTLIGMQDTQDPDRKAVLRFALTTQPEHFERLAGDFQEFLSTVRPEGA